MPVALGAARRRVAPAQVARGAGRVQVQTRGPERREDAVGEGRPAELVLFVHVIDNDVEVPLLWMLLETQLQQLEKVLLLAQLHWYLYLFSEVSFIMLNFQIMLAILLVVLFHWFSLPMGWTGVDLFFVLSGFLFW